jgi:ketosteroid isomerase-like protein
MKVSVSFLRVAWILCSSIGLSTISASFFGNKIKNQNRISKSIVERYFGFWNERKMDDAIACFSDDCTYEDTLYSAKFMGKAALKSHLFRVADSLPDSFQFKIDTISEDNSKSKSSINIGVKWHVESDGANLPFTRGCSMYTVTDGLISSGFDVPEPVIKSGDISLQILSFLKNILLDRKRLILVAAWSFYCWFLFLSDIAPGNSALKFDPNVLKEVLDLSLNFWLVFPILSTDSAPVLHPVLEGTFNLVLVYSALFFGFLVDGIQKIYLNLC